MITIVYNVLARGEEYVELGGDYYEQQNKPRVVSRLVARLMKLGYYVDLKPVEPYEPNEPAPVAVPPEPAAESTSGDPVLAVAADAPAVKANKRRGRPCKCAERGITCTHGTSGEVNSLTEYASSPARFS